MRSNATNRASRGRRPGFSLVELLVVAGILVLLLLFAAGALSSIFYSSERSLAENQLRVGLTAARDMAIRSDGGDAGALFLFQDGRVSIVPVVQVGTLRQDQVLDENGQPVAGEFVDRDVFVPVPGAAPTVMPRGWTVRGFAPPGSIRDGWYNDSTQAYFDPTTPVGMTNPNPFSSTWVFPEDWFYDDQISTNRNVLATQGWKRQSFFIRYEAGTGNLSDSGTGTCLVLSPAQSDFFRDLPEFDPLPRVNDSDDLQSYARRALQLPTTQARVVIGNLSSDTILVRAVTEFALTDENRLIASMDPAFQPRGLNKNTGSMYVWLNSPSVAIPLGPSFDPRLFATGVTTEQVQAAINKAIVPDPTVANAPGPYESRIFTVQRYLGQVQEFTP